MSTISPLNEEQRLCLYMIMLAETDTVLNKWSKYPSDRSPCNDGFCVLIAALIGDDEGRNTSYWNVPMLLFPELNDQAPNEEDRYGFFLNLWFDIGKTGWMKRRELLVNAINKLS